MDYSKIPEIAEKIERIQALEAGGESIAGWFLYEPGKKLLLTVEVTEPEVARVILGSSFGHANLMPGMKITDIRFGDLERKDVVKAWLQQQIESIS
jgi:hypothetical protein